MPISSAPARLPRMLPIPPITTTMKQSMMTAKPMFVSTG